MGGKNSDNSEMINMQKAEAEEARQKEAQRKARIDKGLAAIKGAFEGKETFKNVAGKATKLTGDKLPAGYSYVMEGATAPTTKQVRGQRAGREGNMVNTVQTVQVPGKAGTKMVKGPDGKLYAVGSTVTPTTQVSTGKTGGFGDEFYNKFRNSITDYYLPQVQEQYGDAQNEMLYRLARAGLARSSAGNEEFADLLKQNELNVANVKSEADKAVAGVKQNVANAREQAESQLYATENPEVASNSALASVRNISATEPDLSPLAAVFNLATVGGANFMKGYNNQRYKSQVPGTSGADASRVV